MTFVTDSKPRKNIGVFCSSSRQAEGFYLKTARQFGEGLAQEGFSLVFGGTDSGCMHELASGVKAGGGSVTGVIPESMHQKGLAFPGCDILIIEKDLARRKDKLFALSDAVVILPGGPGTLDELMSLIASGLCGEHRKPALLINAGGFYDDLLRLFEKMKRERLWNEDKQLILTVVTDISHALQVLKSWRF